MGDMADWMVEQTFDILNEQEERLWRRNMAKEKEMTTLTGIVGKEEYQMFREGVGKNDRPWKMFKFSIGVDTGGGKREYTVCIAWGNLAELWREELREGEQVTATGEMKANTWKGKTTLQLHCKTIAMSGVEPAPADIPAQQELPVAEPDPMDDNFL